MSVGLQCPPGDFKTPPIHFTKTVGPANMVPVRSASAGFRMVWSALRVISKPKKLLEELMFTATLS